MGAVDTHSPSIARPPCRARLQTPRLQTPRRLTAAAPRPRHRDCCVRPQAWGPMQPPSSNPSTTITVDVYKTKGAVPKDILSTCVPITQNI